MRTLDILAAVLVLGGSTLALTAAIGVVRFPDTLTRMHAATKPQVLGLLLVLIGAAIRLRGNADVGMVILTGLFTLITAPVIANRVGQLAYREQNIRDDLLTKDEMREFAESGESDGFAERNVEHGCHRADGRRESESFSERNPAGFSPAEEGSDAHEGQ